MLTHQELAVRLAQKAGWRVSEWADAAGLSRSTVYNLLDARAIESVKVGKARVIKTTPAEFLAGCPRV
jgi:excisionase family DNA binding protein